MVQRQKLEHKILIKKIALRAGIALAILFVLYLWVFGIFSNINNFWKNLGRNRTVANLDTLPPIPPYLNKISEFTNKESVEIAGSAESGTKVTLFLNREKISETIADKDGSFNFGPTKIVKGTNTFFAKAKDDAENESVESESRVVVFDNQKPKIDINTPKNGGSYSSKVRSLSINGKAESGSKILINQQTPQIRGDGEFFLSYYPQEGSNKITVEITDKAGNGTKEDIFFTFNEE
jgi:hypothetical protein